MTTIFSTPRPVPGRLAPALAGTAVIALALPVFLVAAWPVRGWLLAAVLWLAGQALGLVLARLPLGADNLAASGVRGIGMGFRAFVVGIPLVVVAATNEAVGLAAALLYVLAYTVELAVGLVTYFAAEARA
jgi:hypothetical protein